jgi:P-type E1-E2 ATPase
LHVGDIIYVEYGMAIPVDGICLQAVQLMADEAAMTGESDEVKKEPLAKCLSYQREKEMDTTKTTTVKITRAHDLPSPIMMSGSSISGGEGKMVSIMVGDDSSIGQIMKIT